MPLRAKDRKPPSWVEHVEDDCLYTSLIEVFGARSRALRWGALRYKPSAKAFNSAEMALQMIYDGRVQGPTAWKKASDALRKFNTAEQYAYAKRSVTRR